MELGTPRRHAASINLDGEVIPYDDIVNPDLLARVDELHAKFVVAQPFRTSSWRASFLPHFSKPS